MKKLNLSKFDLGMVIAFVVITLAGVGGWWYLSGALSAAQDEVTQAKSDFDKYSSNPQYHVVVSPGNLKTLQSNIDLIQAQITPVVQAQFQSKDNKLSQIHQEDPVAWKHDLDQEVHALNAAAKGKVTVPANYYFGFSRYLNASPSDEQIQVLSKQKLAIEQMANILIAAPVKNITAIRRSYEEDPRPTGNGAPEEGTQSEGPDHLDGRAATATDGAYIAYPFEIDFDTTPESFRTVIDNLIQSPYVFVIRSVAVKSSIPGSPLLNSLDAMAGTPPSSVVGTSPGEVAATTSTRGPQYLFGNAILKVKMRIDIIEWTGNNTTADNSGKNGQAKKGGAR